MRVALMGVWLAVATTAAAGAGEAWAQATVAVTRQESTPRIVEVKVGQEVQFINNTGGIAHVMFSRNDAMMFYVGKGDSRIKFEKPGTYEYAVHISGVKAHAHTGSVVVK